MSVRENGLVKMFAVVGYHAVVCDPFILSFIDHSLMFALWNHGPGSGPSVSPEI